MNVDSIGGSKYFVTFIDDFSRYTTVYTMKNKNEVFAKFKEYVAYVENQTNFKIKALRSDNGGEYISKEFNEFCSEKGISRQFTLPYSEQNGVAERMNRSILETTRSMLYEANLN